MQYASLRFLRFNKPSLNPRWLFLSLALFAGCGGSDTPPLGRVTGKVVRDGVPVTGVALEFRPTTGRSSPGVTDEQGAFELSYTLREKGALVGEHAVLFRVPPTTQANLKNSQKMSAEHRQILMQSHQEPMLIKHQEHVVVKPGRNEFTFDLSGKK